MAGTFTHLMICKKGLSLDSILGLELWQLLNKYSQFVYLGAVSPDLPYLSFKTGLTNWADVMHYEKTNSNVISGVQELHRNWSMKTPADEVRLAWLWGYVSHLVADATIHPIVNATVGDYAHHKTEHRLCEMTQDSLVFHEVLGIDISYGEFSKVLEFCQKHDAFESLLDFWKTQLLLNYPEKGETPHPRLWFDTYADKAIDAAEGGSKLVGLFRHLGLLKSYLYHTKSEIESDFPDYYRDYYEAVQTPEGVGHFWETGFKRTVTNVVNAWKLLYDGLPSGMPVDGIVQDWNLDTGKDRSGVLTFWS